MNINRSRRLMAALGMGAALAMAAGAYSVAQEATPSPAQTQAQPQNRDRAPDAARPGTGQAGTPFNRGAFRLDRRLEYMHERLEIRPSQEEAWRNFAGAVRNEAQSMRTQFEQRLRERETRQAPPTAIEGLERRQQMLGTMREGLDRILGAMRPLYAALDANQKSTADRMLSRIGPMGLAFGGGRFDGGRDFRRFGRDFGGRDFRGRDFRGRGEFFNRRAPAPAADQGGNTL